MSIGRYVSVLYRKSLVYYNTVLEKYGITAAEQPFLMILYRMDGASQEELSSFLMIDKASAARAVESLVKKGYVYKERDPQDKRASRVFLTGKAAAVRDVFVAQSDAWTRFLVEGESPEDVEALFRVLGHMVEKVQATDIKARWGGGAEAAGPRETGHRHMARSKTP